MLGNCVCHSDTAMAGFVPSLESLNRFEFCGIRVLLISQGASFTIDSPERSLRKEMIMTLKSPADPKEVSKYVSGTDVILLYGGTYIENSIPLFNYLKSLSEGKNIRFGVIGYDSEINDVEYLVSEENIAFKIKRPFDMNDLVAAINKCAEERKSLFR